MSGLPEFLATIEYEESENGFIWIHQDTRQKPYFMAAQDRLIDSALVRELPEHVGDTIATPIWSLAHIDHDSRSYWCFIEQGRGGRFKHGGCRFSFAEFKQHPADVWKAGAARAAKETLRPMQWLPETAQDVLAGVAVRQERLRLPGSPADNALFIARMLELLPRRCAVDWVWSTCLFVTVRPFVAGRPPHDLRHAQTPTDDTRWAEAALPALRDVERQHQRVLLALAGEMHGKEVAGDVASAARASTADRLRDFLDDPQLIRALTPEAPAEAPALPWRPAAALPSSAAPLPSGLPEDAVTVPLSEERRQPKPGLRPRNNGVPMVARTSTRSRSEPLVWVAWVDAGNGFQRLGDDSDPAMRPYWLAGERLLETEKVPQGFDQTLDHPLWSLRRVRLEGNVHNWCFVERGRGIRLGRDGRPEPDRQFGIAGGCRFGFASADRAPSDVWRAGAAEAWTRPTTATAGGASGLIGDLLAAVAFDHDRIRLPGTPSDNAVLIDQLLAVLPDEVVANSTWSTCLFRWSDRFVAGALPQDLRAPAFARFADRLAAVPAGARAGELLHRLDDRQRAAFELLVTDATLFAAAPQVGPQVHKVVRPSRAATLQDLLDEMTDQIKDLRPPSLDQVEAMLYGGSAKMLAERYPEIVQQWAGSHPGRARSYLVGRPEETAAPAVLAGLMDAQWANPAENLIRVPTAAAPRPDGARQLAERIRTQYPDTDKLAEMIEAMAMSDGPLHRFEDLSAAGPWLRLLGLDQARHLRLFPAGIIEGLTASTGVPDAVAAALLRAADPLDLMWRAVRTVKSSSGRQAAVMLRVIATTFRILQLPAEQFSEMVRTLASRQRSGGVQWLAEMATARPLHDAPKAEQQYAGSVLSTAGMAISAGQRGRPLHDNRLFEVTQHLGLHVRTNGGEALFQPARGRATVVVGRLTAPMRGLMKARGSAPVPPKTEADQAGGRRQRVVALVGVLALGAGGVFMSLLLIDPVRDPVASPSPSEAVSSNDRTTAAAPAPTPMSGSVGPAVPGTGQPLPLQFDVVWQGPDNTGSALARIDDKIAERPGEKISHITLTGLAPGERVGERAAKEIRDALLTTDNARLKNVPIKVEPNDGAPIGQVVRVVIHFAR